MMMMMMMMMVMVMVKVNDGWMVAVTLMFEDLEG